MPKSPLPPVTLAALDDEVHLQCGCTPQLWKLLTLVAVSIERREDFCCPEHNTVFITDIDVRELAVAFLHFVRSPDGKRVYPDFFLN